mmetsp:Transcript_10247/g.24022  ORF Transcript_10247/g.24022 Transcript_10247/m.24022 type:complete len:408 (-) Transcript_10247:745-1968(-)
MPCFSRGVAALRTMAISRASCPLSVLTAGGSSPRRPRSSRSGLVNAPPLFRLGSVRCSSPDLGDCLGPLLAMRGTLDEKLGPPWATRAVGVPSLRWLVVPSQGAMRLLHAPPETLSTSLPSHTRSHEDNGSRFPSPVGEGTAFGDEVGTGGVTAVGRGKTPSEEKVGRIGCLEAPQPMAAMDGSHPNLAHFPSDPSSSFFFHLQLGRSYFAPVVKLPVKFLINSTDRIQRANDRRKLLHKHHLLPMSRVGALGSISVGYQAEERRKPVSGLGAQFAAQREAEKIVHANATRIHITAAQKAKFAEAFDAIDENKNGLLESDEIYNVSSPPLFLQHRFYPSSLLPNIEKSCAFFTIFFHILLIPLTHFLQTNRHKHCPSARHSGTAESGFLQTNLTTCSMRSSTMMPSA